ncbi:MAG: IS1595 family transposase [Alphaproteobacteria bacterium]
MTSPAKLTVRQFFARFDSDDACLAHVMDVRYGLRHDCRKCGTVGATFHKLTNRRAYSCAHCGDHVYPCAGTIFEDSRTSLQCWFYAIYLFVTTRHGVSGKELERQLGVTYKTAWRMGQQIRLLMAKADGWEMLMDHVEVDEAYIGGRRPASEGRGRGAGGKTIVVGMKERGGRIATKIVPNVGTGQLRRAVVDNIEMGSIVSTDELNSYRLLTGAGYQHGTVKHGAKEYARYDDALGVTHHVNGIENFWGLFKRSIRSTHIHVSPKYLDRYLGEFVFRSNRRAMRNAMFDLLIGAV